LPGGVNDLEILLNELSLEGQFNSVQSFWKSLDSLMRLRGIATKGGHEIGCGSSITTRQATDGLKIFDAIQYSSDPNKKRAVMIWITKSCKYWSERRKHTDDDYLVCNNEIVTETAIGESAFRLQNNLESSIVSFFPSSWLFSPVRVDCLDDSESPCWTSHVENHWSEKDLTGYLENIQAPVQSWENLRDRMRNECKKINFSEDAFNPLLPHPYVRGASDRIVVLLNILNKYAQCFDKQGNRTKEGHEIYQNNFVGENAHFSDSSDDEKNTFEYELKFSLPGRSADKILCGWHGKVQTPQLRIHFAWPEKNGENIDVVYVGPKITKR